MALLDYDVRDARAVGRLDLKARLSYRREFILQHMLELSFTNAVPVYYDSERLKATRRPVESHEVFFYHVCEILNYFHPCALNFD